MSLLSSSPYPATRATWQCAATGTPIAPGERYVACLAEHPESQPLLRLDYSAAAWESGARPEPPAALFAFWWAHRPEGGDQPRTPLIDDSALLELFEQLEGEDDPRRVAFRFVLALLLLRKRVLAQEPGAAKGRLLVRVRGTPKPPKGPAPIEVIDPGLDEASLRAVTEQLSQVLAGGGSEPEAGDPAGQSP